MNVLGLIEPPFPLDEAETAAVAEANRLISTDFQNALFWNYRYAAHPGHGSGVGSRGENLLYKRQLLKEQGVESAQSVLDVGCGDLEVLRELDIHDYIGFDVSEEALKTARAARPDWQFSLLLNQPLDKREMVLCLEVLIHQSTREQYDELVSFLAEHTGQTLIVSGYERKDDPRHMVHFYEALGVSLARTGRFQSIRAIGAHTDVTVFRCDVEGVREA
jgi:SAM-dependent methyltransferase